MSVRAIPGLVAVALIAVAAMPAALAQTVSEADIDALKAALDAQKAITQQLQDRLGTLESAAAKPAPASSAGSVNAGYDKGFYLRDASGNNSLSINGLLQPRFNNFQTGGTQKFGQIDRTSDNFDVFLGRLYFSGTVVDPSIGYFFTLQGSTTTGNSGLSLLDAEIYKSFNPYLKVEAGKYWSAYTYEYYDDIAKYLLPDLSAAEWAFGLGRQEGVRFSGTAGNLIYRASVSNSIPGLDLGNTLNLHSKLALIGNLEYNILAPYGYQETDPNPKGAESPELSIWASGFYNPVEYRSAFANDVAGDNTDGATASLNFRSGYFTFQGSGYYKHNDSRGADSAAGAHPGFDSTGWQEQAGYYILPGQLELAERIDGITWGYGQIATAAPGVAGNPQWYAGPSNFSFHGLTEYTAGLNYYLSGHQVKGQFAYSYLDGDGFNHLGFHANRLLAQAQVAF